MPRKDRRFTADDVLRFYCRNLTPLQKALVDAAGLDSCGDVRTDEDMVGRLLDALTSPPLSTVIGRMPAGGYLLDVIELIRAVEVGTIGADEIEWAVGRGAVLPVISPRGSR